MSYVEEDHGQYDEVAPIFWATGACLLVRARVYKELGGLDANFFAHQEEIDLCWRIHRQCAVDTERLIVSLPQSVVYHVGGGTLGYENPRKTFLNFRNNLLMLRKNLPMSRLWWVMIVRFFMDYLAALQMLATRQPQNAKAVFQARWAYHQMKKQYAVLRTSERMKNNGIVQRSIVWDFYVRRKKK